MRVGISLTSNHPDVKDPRQGARWMIERAAAAHRAALDSLFVGDQHVSPTPYYQNKNQGHFRNALPGHSIFPEARTLGLFAHVAKFKNYAMSESALRNEGF
jgi:hypothetical protein